MRKTIISIALFLVLAATTVSAQTPAMQLFLTWKALNFYPSNFEGKALATLNSTVVVSLEAIRGGTWLDLSPYELAWELDGTYLGGGRGVKQVRFIVTKGFGDSHFLRVSARLGSEILETSTRIPVADQRVVIDAPYPDHLARGNTITLHAVPFFFNIASLSDLSFTWTVGGERRAVGSDNELIISGGTTPSPRILNVTLEAQNRVNPQETASARGQFSINP